MTTNILTARVHGCGTVRRKPGLALNSKQQSLIGLSCCPVSPPVGELAIMNSEGILSSCRNCDKSGYVLLTGSPKPVSTVQILTSEGGVLRTPPLRSRFMRCRHEFLELWRVPNGHKLFIVTHKNGEDEEWTVGVQDGNLNMTSRTERIMAAEAGREKGAKAEQMFINAWQHEPDYHAHRATAYEDLHEKTDAWICSLREPWRKYRVQIKSGKGHNPCAFYRQGLVLVEIDVQNDTPATIRFKTHFALREFHRVNPNFFGGRLKQVFRRYRNRH